MTGEGFNLGHIEFLLWGALWTMRLAITAFAGGILLGLPLALCRVSPLAWVRRASGCYTLLVQGTPLLVLIFLVYFGLSMLGLELSPLVAAGVALTIYASAYLGEIWRGCIESVPRAQWEAAECLPLTRAQRMRLVVMPQALRIATPSTVGFVVQIIKNSSLASALGFVELTRAGQLVSNSLFQPFIVYVAVAVLYFALCYPLSRWSRNVESRLAGRAAVQHKRREI
jgi:polar amino acid transport system permease protein